MNTSLVLVWLGISLTTGKYSEEMKISAYKSEAECLAGTDLFQDRVCFPTQVPPEYLAKFEAQRIAMAKKKAEELQQCLDTASDDFFGHTKESCVAK